MSGLPLGVSRPTQPVRVLIADRNLMSSQLLVESLERDSRFEVVAVSQPADVLSVAALRKPDVAVISAEFDRASRKGMEIARALNGRHPGIGIVILLELEDRDAVIASFRNGARGVFCRTEPLSEFRSCLERVRCGQIRANSIETGYVLELMKSLPSLEGVGEVNTLSKREIEVAEAAAQGFTNRQIADRLGLSEHTVKNYLFRVFEKLDVSSRVELLFLLEHNSESKRRFKAAEQGFVTAEFIVGLAQGSEVGKSGHSAYYWLRLTEKNSLELLQRVRVLIEELKSKMEPRQVEALERRLVITENNRSLKSKGLGELLQESVNLLSRVAR